MARPASQGRNVTTAAGAAQFGSTLLGRIAAQVTGTYQGVLAAIRAAFPRLSFGQANVAAGRGYRLAQYFSTALSGNPQGTIPQSIGQQRPSVPAALAAGIGTGQAIPLAFRYVVNVTYPDPLTGQQVSYRDVIDSNTALTRERITSEAMDRARAGHTSDSPQEPGRAEIPDSAMHVALLSYFYQ
jgi:hypothetical protein